MLLPISLSALVLLLQRANGTPVARQAACATLPATIPTPSISYLPDPFTTLQGSKVTTLDQWTCRQQEINQLFQRMELGTLPPKPSSVTASFSGSTLTINVSDGGKSISFSVSIQYPTSGTAPYPALIALDGGSLPAPAGVAIITFSEGDIAQQTDGSSRGKGKFYDLYGSNASAGALMAWAWGISRVVDALEMTPSARINTYSLGVTGCSRNGKGALVAGAFEPRIALTIPQESGSGGDSSWRISDYIGSSTTQTAGEIIGENVWFSTNFNQYVNKVPVLPFDHRMLAGLVAPRALFAIENTDYAWLGPLSAYGDMSATKLIYQAIGKSDNFGFSQVGGHAHCSFPSSQQSDLDAYVGKFLLNKTTTTNIFRTTGNYQSQFSTSQWIPWANSVPTLSGTGSSTGGSGSGTGGSTSTVSSATSPATSPTSAPGTGACAAHYGQCGGTGWTGSTCCAAGTTCKVANSYYSQCL